MAATAGGTGSGEPDMGLVGELLEQISRHPPAIAARKLLVQHYMTVGWLDAATENARELERLAPGDNEVAEFLKVLTKKPELPAAAPASARRSTPRKPAPSMSALALLNKKKRTITVRLGPDLDKEREDFAKSYTALQSRAKSIIGDLLRFKALQKKRGLPESEHTETIHALAEGDRPAVQDGPKPPGSALSVSRSIQASPDNALEIAITDLEHMMEWIRARHDKESGADDDTVREALLKRVKAIENTLAKNLKQYPEIALMHISHEYLGKTYVNDETMLGDEVKDIPRENFYVTEDNYAWDMEELAQAITANGGVMRNPLSKQLFTPKDIQGISAHKHGKPLRALQVQQHEMAKGVRPNTIDHMEKLAKVLLDDQSSELLPSRIAVDEFLAYVATLPELEQKALDGLKCPARDSHTGQAYDFSVGEAVRDAKGNRVCFHKTGDFINQAATYLRKNRGAPPNVKG